MKFSERKALEKRAKDWCKKNNVPENPFNIITALDNEGYISQYICAICGYRHKTEDDAMNCCSGEEDD